MAGQSQYDEARRLYDAEDYERAYPLLRRIVREQAHDGYYQGRLAYCEYRLNGRTRLFWESLEATKRDPLNQDIALQIEGTLLMEEGRAEEGIQRFRQAVEAQRDQWNLTILGSWLEQLHTSEADREAQQCYENALALDPECAWALTRLAGLHAEKGGHRLAVECLERARRLNPDLSSPSDHYLLGWCYHELKEYRSALFHYRAAIERGYEDRAGVEVALAEAFGDMGELDQARTHVEQCLAIDPDSSAAEELKKRYGL